MSAARPSERSGLVFFSGGSAMTDFARMLAESGVHATYIISVFDNGGSAGRLRDVCGGIAIGDIRKRLIAIGDRSTAPSRRVIDLLQSRVPADGSARTARALVEEMACGTGALLRGVAKQTAADISQAMTHLLAAMPATFEWQDTSVGNLILAGRYGQCGDWGGVLRWAHSAVSACGTVLPVATDGACLGARLVNGRSVRGQNVLTDETRPIESPIERLELFESNQSSAAPAGIAAYGPAIEDIETGRVIVYSWGSFYTSVVCSLLVQGIVPALAASPAPKVLLLNPFTDAETRGKQPRELIDEVFRYGRRGNGMQAGRLVTHVLALRVADPSRPALYDLHHRAQLEALGLHVVEVESQGMPQGPKILQIMERLLALSGSERRGTACRPVFPG